MRWAGDRYTDSRDVVYKAKKHPVVNTIVVICSLMLFVQTIKPDIVLLLGLIPQLLLEKYYIWQLITYQFLHGGFFHLFLNMFALWMFGRHLEEIWGSFNFAIYYLVCGIGAGLTSAIISGQTTIGASGAVYGILLAFGLLFPNQYLMLYFLFPVRARTLVIIFAVFEFVASLTSTGDGIAHSAHLAGMVVGFIYLKVWQYIGSKKHIKKIINFNEVVKYEKGVNEELDRILSKIKEFGVDSLTSGEKRFLDETSNYYKNKRDNYFN